MKPGILTAISTSTPWTKTAGFGNICANHTGSLSSVADGGTLYVNRPGGSQTTPPQAKLPPRKDIFGTWLLTSSRNRGAGGPQPMPTPAAEKGERIGRR